MYGKVKSSNTSHFEAYAGFFRWAIEVIFDAYVLWPFSKNFPFELVMRVWTRDFTLSQFQSLKICPIMILVSLHNKM